jgi:hypothetical protein
MQDEPMDKKIGWLTNERGSWICLEDCIQWYENKRLHFELEDRRDELVFTDNIIEFLVHMHRCINNPEYVEKIERQNSV